MTRHRMFGLVLFALGCTSQQAGAGRLTDAKVQFGADDISAVLKAEGHCNPDLPGLKTYEVSEPENRSALIRLIGSGVFMVSMDGKDKERTNAVVIRSEQQVFWFGPAESFNDSHDLDDPVGQNEARAEWSSPRGQLMLQLVARAESACARDSSGGPLRH